MDPEDASTVLKEKLKHNLNQLELPKPDMVPKSRKGSSRNSLRILKGEQALNVSSEGMFAGVMKYEQVLGSIDPEEYGERLLFPNKILDVFHVEKKEHAAGSSGSEVDSLITEPHMLLWLEWFTDNWTIVNRIPTMYEYDHEAGFAVELGPEDVWKCDATFKISSKLTREATRQSVQERMGALFRSLDHVAEYNEYRLANRYNALRTAVGDFTESKSALTLLGNRFMSAPPDFEKTFSPREEQRFQFRMRAHTFKLEMGFLEPFFFTFSLYDVNSGTKISETCSLHLNPDSVMTMIAAAQIEPDTELPHPVEELLFTIAQADVTEIYLVCKMYKVCDGNTDTIQYYTQSGNSANSERIRQAASTFCYRLGAYRIPFAWAALPCYDTQGQFVLEGEQSFQMFHLYTPKTNILGDMVDVASRKAGRGKGINAKLEITVTPRLRSDEKQPPTRDSSLREVLSASVQPGSHSTLLEVTDFPAEAIPGPLLEYRHNFYVRPLRAELAKYLSQNKHLSQAWVLRITLHESDADPESPGLPCFVGDAPKYPRVRHRDTCVARHKTAIWDDEMKLILPARLGPTLHLRFTLLSIDYSSKGPVEKPVAYAWQMLYQGQAIISDGEIDLKLRFTESLPTRYTMKRKDDWPANSQNKTLKVQLLCDSTILPKTRCLSELYHTYHLLPGFDDARLMAALKECSTELSHVEIVQQLPVLLTALFHLMCSRPKSVEAAHTLCASLVRAQKALGSYTRPRTGLIASYVRFAFAGIGDAVEEYGKPFSEVLMSNFLMTLMMRSKKPTPEVTLNDIFHIGWFFFDCIIKVLILELADSSRLNRNGSRQGFPSVEFLKLAKKLVVISAKTLLHAKDANAAPAREFNASLAIFLCDLFDVADRGHVIDMLYDYGTTLQQSESDVMRVIQFDLYRIVMDHPQLIALNLPVKDLSFSSVNDVIRAHPVSSALFLALSVELGRENLSEAGARYGVHVLLGVVTSLEYENGIPDNTQLFAQVFLPLILVLVQRWRALDAFWDGAGEFLYARRGLCLCVLWVLQKVDRTLLRRIWDVMTLEESLAFFGLCEQLVRAFEFEGGLAMGFLPQSSASKHILMGMLSDESDLPDERARALASEASLTILDIVEMFLDKEARIAREPAMVEGPGQALCTLITCSQSLRVQKSCWDALQCMVLRYPSAVFDCGSLVQGLTRQIMLLCNVSQSDIADEGVAMLYLLLQTNQRVAGNFEHMQTCATTTLASLVAGGHMLDDGVVLKQSLSSLSSYALREYASASLSLASESVVDQLDSTCDPELCFWKVEFVRAVQGLTRALTKVLLDTIKAAQLKDIEDPETISDLYYDIADGYENIPVLRITWLRALAEYHNEKEYYAEAGMCMTRVAMLIQDHLSRHSNKHLYDEFSVFEKVLGSTIQEYADANSNASFRSDWFSRSGFLDALKIGADYFAKGEFFEFAEALYLERILPLEEADYEYQNIAKSHEKLANYYQMIEKTDDERMLGKYFRVGFYGHSFGSLDGTEFIYAEPRFTHLYDLKDRLVAHFERKLGETVEIAKDSRRIDPSKLDSAKPLIQMTSVTPYFGTDDEDQDIKRDSFFTRSTNLRLFYYDTPFSKGGKVGQAATKDQYKITTIMGVAQPFPYVLKRQPVVSREERESSPIEIAIEAMTKRNEMLVMECERKPVILNNLQQVLAGSVAVSVNAGPVEFTQIFLSPEGASEWNAGHVAILRRLFRKFISHCAAALALNGRMVEDVQRPFHDNLVEQFKELKKKIGPSLRDPWDRRATAAAGVSVKLKLPSGSTPELNTKKLLSARGAASSKLTASLPLDVLPAVKKKKK